MVAVAAANGLLISCKFGPSPEFSFFFHLVIQGCGVMDHLTLFFVFLIHTYIHKHTFWLSLFNKKYFL